MLAASCERSYAQPNYPEAYSEFNPNCQLAITSTPSVLPVSIYRERERPTAYSHMKEVRSRLKRDLRLRNIGTMSGI